MEWDTEESPEDTHDAPPLPSLAAIEIVVSLPCMCHAVLFAMKIPGKTVLAMCPAYPTMDLLDVFIAANNVSGFPGTSFRLSPEPVLYLWPLKRIIRQMFCLAA